MALLEVVGVRLSGQLNPGVTATDVGLYVTQRLRQYGVVEKFVEFFSPGVKRLSVQQRATLANMAPKYGATIGLMPVDEQAVDYLKLTNRGGQAEFVEGCARSLGLFYRADMEPEYSDVVDINLSDVEPAVAGPSRPHQRIVLADLKKSLDGPNDAGGSSALELRDPAAQQRDLMAQGRGAFSNLESTEGRSESAMAASLWPP